MNEIIDIEPTVGYVTFRRPDDVIVFITPGRYPNTYEFTYSNHPNAHPTLISRDNLTGFFAANPHIAAALDAN